jgi:hypothetical protein
MKSIILILLLLFSSSIINAQMIVKSPIVINIGGGSYSGTSIGLEWNIGEITSIDAYTSGSWQMYTGVLQTSIAYPFIRNISPGEIKLGPNPFRDKIKVETAFKTEGTVTVNVYDNFSRKVFTKDFISRQEYFNEWMLLQKLLNGLYYLEVIYNNPTGQKNRNIYKIIKF